MPSPITASRPPLLPLAAFGLAAGFALTPWATPALALALGALLSLTLGNPAPALTARGARHLLQAAVVGLGFGMPLSAVVSAGRTGILYTVAGIATALTLGLLLGRRLKVERQTSLLITAGTSICGGSAIAALGPAIGARSEAMSVALATVFVLNAVALYLFPPVGHLLHLSQHQFAVWAAIAIHDTSSVVGAAASYGPVALGQATVLKLARALWIVPLTLAASAAARRSGAHPATDAGAPTVRVPWFIGLFVLAAAARSLLPAAAGPVLDGLAGLAKTALVLTLFLIGAGLSRPTLRAVGVRPLVQGVLLWVTVGGLALLLAARWVPA
ncbi:MAG TPA: putative sulfate exporter family transporter [Gemmatimonadales bacterium]|nr:putative sulfate exporter family transporter [Gemmatimonadales bacterium]